VSLEFGFGVLCSATEQSLVRALQLQALPLPAELVRLAGSWKGQPVTLSARAYAGPRIGYARFVEIAGAGLDIGNVLLLSEAEYPLPMLCADLVGLGKDTGVEVADLSPVPPLREQAPLSEQDMSQLRGLALPPGGELPAWCGPWFSAQPLFARVAPQHAPAVAAALEVLCQRFLQLAGACEAQPGAALAVAQWQAQYCEAHRRDDRGLNLLHKMFDPALADRFLRRVLFPEGARG
jgi:phycocyanobilin:ferredoxin oxidoreductase